MLLISQLPVEYLLPCSLRRSESWDDFCKKQVNPGDLFSNLFSIGTEIKTTLSYFRTRSKASIIRTWRGNLNQEGSLLRRGRTKNFNGDL